MDRTICCWSPYCWPGHLVNTQEIGPVSKNHGQNHLLLISILLTWSLSYHTGNRSCVKEPWTEPSAADLHIADLVTYLSHRKSALCQRTMDRTICCWSPYCWPGHLVITQEIGPVSKNHGQNHLLLISILLTWSLSYHTGNRPCVKEPWTEPSAADLHIADLVT